MKLQIRNPFSKAQNAQGQSLIDQQVIHDNEVIHATIVNRLIGAKDNVLIAAAWFTDQDLYDVLVKKVNDGVKVEVVLSDNQENNRLPFDELERIGALILRVKASGYGIMNQKFCIIDHSFALHGSYNWTVNARKNNNESIIATNHRPTVDSLIQTFESLKTKSKEQSEDSQRSEQPGGDGKVTSRETRPKNMSSDSNIDFMNVLDSMIAAEVANFDRVMLRQQGFDRAKSNNGDHQVLTKALDTVYSVFINDIDVIDDKKRRLIAKVEQQKLQSIESIKEKADLSLSRYQTDIDIKKQQQEAKIAANNSLISINDEKVHVVKSKIKLEEDQLKQLEGRIQEEKLAFIRPAHRYFELVPLVSFCLFLIIYLFIFYSSAAYIMIYSASEAESQQLKGIVEVPEVFNPHAFERAWEKGIAAFGFILMFVFVPIILAVLPKISRFKGWKEALTFGGIILVDAVIAYKVAQVVHQVHMLRGDVTTPWHFVDVLKDSNFYLVFILGALGLFLFKFIYAKLITYFEDRNLDYVALKSKATIKECQNNVLKKNTMIQDFNEEISRLEQNNILLRAENQLSLAEIEQGPLTMSAEKERVLADSNQQTQVIRQTADLYTSHIENDNLPISLDSLKDRINIFLEGWNDFLHQQYSITKATEMSTLAANSVNQWQEQKIVTQKIDRRVKI